MKKSSFLIGIGAALHYSCRDIVNSVLDKMKFSFSIFDSIIEKQCPKYFHGDGDSSVKNKKKKLRFL